MPRIVKVGGSSMVALPKDVLARANLGLGDELVAVPIRDGMLLKARATVSGAMHEALQDDMDRRPDVYRRLAQ